MAGFPSFDKVLKELYLPSLQEQWDATSWMTSIPPRLGPPEPAPDEVFEGADVRVERRCNGEPMVWVRQGEYYDWEQIDRDEAAELVAVLKEWE